LFVCIQIHVCLYTHRLDASGERRVSRRRSTEIGARDPRSCYQSSHTRGAMGSGL
jgi:hypothetical protein